MKTARGIPALPSVTNQTIFRALVEVWKIRYRTKRNGQEKSNNKVNTDKPIVVTTVVYIENYMNKEFAVTFTGGSRRLHWRGPTAASAKITEQISKLWGSGGMPPEKYFFTADCGEVKTAGIYCRKKCS